MKPKIQVLYCSGAGGTRLVAELLGEALSESGACGTAGIFDPRAQELAADSDFLVLCYPTYYLKPAPSMREFIGSLGPFDPPRDAYVVATCELYSENSVRRCARLLERRGVRVVGSKVVRAPGSDLSCVLPSRLVPWLFRFEKGLPDKLRTIAGEIRARLEAPERRSAVPAPRWYTPFSQLFQFIALDRFDLLRFKFRVLAERCDSCGACVALCNRGAWSMPGSAPLHAPESCELCTRCIHRCPRKAIVLLPALKDNPRLDARLYARLKEEARSGYGH